MDLLLVLRILRLVDWVGLFTPRQCETASGICCVAERPTSCSVTRVIILVTWWLFPLNKLLVLLVLLDFYLAATRLLSGV